MKKILLYVFIFLCMSCNIISASWSKNTVKQFKEIEKKYTQINSGVISLWSVSKRVLANKKLKGRLRKIKLPSFFGKGSLKIYFERRKKSKILIVHLPGFTASHSKKLKTRSIVEDAIKHYSKLKVNIIAIPNFMSPTYTKQQPLVKGDSLDFHLETSYQVLIEALKKFKLNKEIEKVVVVSESLGAFTALSIRKKLITRNQFKTHQVINLLLWPPFDLYESIKNIDEKVKAYQPIYKQCNWFKYAPLTFYHFLWRGSPKSMSSNLQQCLDSFVYSKAFLNNAFKSLKVFQRYHKVPFKKGQTLSDFLNSMDQSFLRNLQGSLKTKLSFWFTQKEKEFIYLITSEDDFINKSNVFQNYELENKFIFMKGGHLGYYPFLPFKNMFNDILNTSQ